MQSPNQRGRLAPALLSPPSYGVPEGPSLKVAQRRGENARDTAALLLLEAIITNIPWNVLQYK